jgi:hypothetical protein
MTKSCRSFQLGKIAASTIDRVQFPLLHHVQGKTLHDGGVLDLFGTSAPGLHYTPLTRFTDIAKFFILDFNAKAIRTSRVAVTGMRRLQRTRQVALPLPLNTSTSGISTGYEICCVGARESVTVMVVSILIPTAIPTLNPNPEGSGICGSLWICRVFGCRGM